MKRQSRLCALFGTIFRAVLGAVCGLLLLFGRLPAASADAPTIHNFDGVNGANPAAALIQASDGNFYGTTTGNYTGVNGTGGNGTVFKLTTDSTPAGTTLTTLVTFTGPNGQDPQAGLIQGSDGSFYGTTDAGGSSGDGTIFKMTTDGTAAGTTLTTLVNFNGTNGANPRAALIQGSDGNFYGTTYSGGSRNYGTVFKLTTDGTAAGTTLTTLLIFKRPNGSYPEAALIQGSDGSFYGTTDAGGTVSGYGTGTVFKLTTNGTAAGTTLTTLVSFNRANGAYPDAALIQGRDGSFYGTTYYGGSEDAGTVFKLTTNGTAAGTTLTTLVNFNGANGSAIAAGLLLGDDGNFYGAAAISGSNNNGYGTVFKMTTDGTAAGTNLTTLVRFNGANGEYPDATLIQGDNGKFYGTTSSGDESSNFGTVFALDPRAIQSVRFTPMTLTGGKTAMGEVTLSHVADTDQLVTLTSSNPATLPIRASVTITTDHRHALFTVTAKPVTKATTITITATLNGVSSYSTITVTP